MAYDNPSFPIRLVPPFPSLARHPTYEHNYLPTRSLLYHDGSDDVVIYEVDLGWTDLRLTMKVSPSAANSYRREQVILDGSIRGRAVPGRMTAIMGYVGGTNHRRGVVAAIRGIGVADAK
jgi:hypothetical protein